MLQKKAERSLYTLAIAPSAQRLQLQEHERRNYLTATLYAKPGVLTT